MSLDLGVCHRPSVRPGRDTMNANLDLRAHWEGGTASFSEDGRYRYDLTRRWRDGDLMLWIMLNPSTADASVDDPTIRRCINFAKREDAAGIAVVNLFALRATDPDDLLKADHPIGPDNIATINDWLRRDDVALAVAAWGAWWTNMPFDRRIPRLSIESLARKTGRDLVCLGRTKFGAPRHPLYVSRHEPFGAYDGGEP